ncbi:MAG: hypothetical protein ACRBDL_00995 [Alphaproteobacteria bacterium]
MLYHLSKITTRAIDEFAWFFTRWYSAPMQTLDRLKDTLKNLFADEDTSYPISYYPEQVKAALIDLPVSIHTTDISLWNAYKTAYQDLELWRDLDTSHVSDKDLPEIAQKIQSQLIENGAYQASANEETTQFVINTLTKKLSQCLEENNGTNILKKIRQFDELRPSPLSLVVDNTSPQNG